MISFINICLISFFWVIGLTIVTQKGMGLYSIREWAEKKGTKLMEPVILCPWCMPSIHCMFGYFFSFASGVVDFNYKLILMYPIAVMATSLFSGLTWSLYKLVEINIKVQNNKESLTYFDLKDRKERYSQKRLQQHKN